MKVINYKGVVIIPVVFQYESNGAMGLLFKTDDHSVHTILTADLIREVGNPAEASPGCIWARFHNGYIEFVEFLINEKLAELTQRSSLQGPYVTFVELRLTGIVSLIEKF